jgi:hypothetical protein
MVCVGTRKYRTNIKVNLVSSSCDGKDTAPAVSKSANGKIFTTHCVTRKSYACVRKTVLKL